MIRILCSLLWAQCCSKPTFLPKVRNWPVYQLSGSWNVFSTFDVNSARCHMEMLGEAKDKTSFASHPGLHTAISRQFGLYLPQRHSTDQWISSSNFSNVEWRVVFAQHSIFLRVIRTHYIQTDSALTPKKGNSYVQYENYEFFTNMFGCIGHVMRTSRLE